MSKEIKQTKLTASDELARAEQRSESLAEQNAKLFSQLKRLIKRIDRNTK